VEVPPITVSTFDTERTLAKLPSVSVSLPRPRSIWLLEAVAAASVMVSTPVPPVSVSTPEIVATLAKLPRVSVSSPAPRLMEPLVTMVA
jgi:hypothetical protein